MRIGVLAAALASAGCGATAGNAWVDEMPKTKPTNGRDDGWMGGPAVANTGSPSPDGQLPPMGGPPEVVEVKDFGDGVPRAVISVQGDSLFRNTYYDFPREGAGTKDVTIYDAACQPLTKVTRDFHERVCVQGSGRLSSGGTVSFAKRDCACADTCPRTGQKICYEQLDPARFPSGRGATGKPITPLRTVAVDAAVIPLGSWVFVPEFVGLPRADGSPHDGCFAAEDRGIKVVGRQIDVFTGDPTTTARWNALVPSNRGVHVTVGDARCKGGR